MAGKQGSAVGRMPSDRPGYTVMFLVTTPRSIIKGARLPAKEDSCPPPATRRPVPHKTRAQIAVRAVRYRRGTLMLPGTLRWREACRRAARELAAVAALVLIPVGPRFPLAGDGRPVDDLSPALPVLIARSTLTAAPPSSPVPVPAGAPA